MPNIISDELAFTFEHPCNCIFCDKNSFTIGFFLSKEPLSFPWIRPRSFSIDMHPWLATKNLLHNKADTIRKVLEMVGVKEAISMELESTHKAKTIDVG